MYRGNLRALRSDQLEVSVHDRDRGEPCRIDLIAWMKQASLYSRWRRRWHRRKKGRSDRTLPKEFPSMTCREEGRSSVTPMARPSCWCGSRMIYSRSPPTALTIMALSHKVLS